MSASRTPVVLVMGPTGAGKTDLALRLAERHPIELVSVDSAMVYRGMDVGTGKPERAVLERHPHHLVDILDPAEAYSAGRFVRDVRQVIREIHARGHMPMLVGGTMLYFRALRRGLAQLPEADAAIRDAINAEARAKGWPALHAELAAIDVRSAARIQPKDAQRIQRALEVFRLSGKTLSEFHAETQTADPTLSFYTYVWTPSDRDRLYAAIAARFQAMLRSGLLEEVRRLHERADLHADLPSIRSVGYRQLWQYLDGTVDLETAIANAIVATRHLARRQLIWLRAESDVRWLDTLQPGAAHEIEATIETLCGEFR